ncbi:MAG: C-terminal binding protein [Candidatus Omnitrophota bacterium]
MLKVAVTDYNFGDLAVEKEILEPLGCEIKSQQKYEDQQNLIDLVADADYVITQFAPVTGPVVNAMERCKVIVRYGIGVDNVDLVTAAKKGIPVCNVPDYCIDEVADHTLALILALTRKVVPNRENIKNGRWGLAVPLEQMQVLKRTTVGVVAYGKIGREVALRLKGFKCPVLVFDPFVDSSVIERDGFIPATMEEVFTKSDLISLHCPSTAETKYLINAESIGKMKKGVLLVNTSRGTLVKTDDLIMALKSGQIGAVALDVTDPEPIPADSPLLKMENVVIGSHIAWASITSVQTLRRSAADIVACAIKGEELPNIVKIK